MVTLYCDHGGQEATEDPGQRDGWHKETFCSIEAAIPFIETVADSMAAAAYPEKDIFGMRLALEEAIVNAIKHGHKSDPKKKVWVLCSISPERTLAQIEDQGQGFNPHQVADPTAPENLERSSGRGLFLIRHFTTWARYNQRGNCVTLCKRPSVLLKKVTN